MQEETKQNAGKKHALSLNERKMLAICGVNEVKSFDESVILIETVSGKLSIEGENLHITNLSTDSGNITVNGKIDALIYSDINEKKGGFFSRRFGK